MVKPFVDVSNHVELTHEFADDIDADKWSGITNYLIVGSDSRGNNDVNFSRTDVMIIVSINSNTKKLNIASLLRDTAVQINDETITVSELDESLPNYEVLKENNIKHTKSKTIKLNEAVTYRSDNQKDAFSSGLNSLVNTIEGTYKIPITAIVNITWSDFVNIIDQLEGIDLDITQEMLYTKMVTPDAASGINAAIGELNELYGTNYNFTESGRQHLNGTQALAYVRMRYIEGSDNSDIGRTERIRNFIIELIQQKKSKIFTLASTKTISAISENIYSSFSKDELYDLINEICTTIPTPTEVGCIPYNYENYTRNDKSFVYSEELPEQSEKILCN
jgi:anionic cell wall polymer biosynthesis LytR-Cps2A-Psr (LCP) family protein